MEFERAKAQVTRQELSILFLFVRKFKMEFLVLKISPEYRNVLPLLHHTFQSHNDNRQMCYCT
jgi:hypothetical protein